MAISSYTHCRRCGKKKQPPRDCMSSLCLECDAATSCKHDNHEGGMRGEDWVCAAGVRMWDLVKPLEGSALRTPCFYGIGSPERVTCPKFEPTPIEDCIAFDWAIEESDRRMRLALPVVAQVKKEHRGENWKGSVPCPTGCGGTLHLTHASCNGHVWGKCSTHGCLAWME